MTNESEDLEMEVVGALGRYQLMHGAKAVDTLLKRFGVTRAMDVLPKDFARVIAACAADDDEMPRRRNTRHAASKEDRKLSAFESVVNAAPDLKSGLNMAARAIYARPVK